MDNNGDSPKKKRSKKRQTTVDRCASSFSMDVLSIKPHQLLNPLVLSRILVLSTLLIIQWFQKVHLLRSEFHCLKKTCAQVDSGRGVLMTITRNKSKAIHDQNHIFYCKKCKTTKSIRSDSFFSDFSLCLQEELILMISYIKGELIRHVAAHTGIAKTTICKHFAQFRNVHMCWFQQSLERYKFEPNEIIEVDESLFGRRHKSKQGQRKGIKQWVFGIGGRKSGVVIAYLVPNRSRNTLLPLIFRHTDSSNIIVHDDWSAYRALSEYGRKHITVVHSREFKRTVSICRAGEIESLPGHTNKVEGVWAQMKKYFRARNGVPLRAFQAHLTEILFRVNVKVENWGKEFFNTVKLMFIDGHLSATFEPIIDFDFDNVSHDDDGERYLDVLDVHKQHEDDCDCSNCDDESEVGHDNDCNCSDCEEYVPSAYHSVKRRKVDS